MNRLVVDNTSIIYEQVANNTSERMRRSEKENTDPKIIENVLLNSELCRIGLADGEEAYIVPMNYGYKEGCLYFHSAPKGRKMELLRKNNRVSFEITQDSRIISGEKPCDWTARYLSVMGLGRIEIIEDAEAKKSGLDVIMRKYGATGDLEYRDSSLRNMVILKLNVESLSAKQSGNW